MGEDLIARASMTTSASRDEVWKALVDAEAIERYMFGTHVVTDWQEGSPILWKGTWNGRSYEDKGVILRFEPKRMLRYSHFSPLSGLPDKPESYHTVTVELSPAGAQTRVTLAQDNNPTEEARAHSEKNWAMMLAALKDYLESSA
jgi:uncharacterized protein YndB with AHSA1/START domain